MSSIDARIGDVVQALVGLALSSTAYAGNMRTFQFGPLRRIGSKIVGVYSLHIQCPWRLMDRVHGTILTGSSDWSQPADPGSFDIDNWDPARDGNLQQVRLTELLGDYDAECGSIKNATGSFLVSSVKWDAFGGCEIEFDKTYCLSIVPTGSREEAWRLFRLGVNENHLVVGYGLADEY